MTRRMAALLHSRTREFRRRLDGAERIIDAWLARCSAPAVEFSGGKDSSVVLHLVRSRIPDAPALHGDDEWYLPETEALLRATPGLVRLRRPLRHCDWFTAWEHLPGPNGGSKHRWALEHGRDGVASGLRAEENNRRRAEIRIHGEVYVLANGLIRAYPIAWWGWRDVWAYIETRGVPYSAAYDVLERLGIPPEHQRTGPFASERALACGQMGIIKRGWPEVWDRFVAAHPEAYTYL